MWQPSAFQNYNYYCHWCGCDRTTRSIVVSTCAHRFPFSQSKCFFLECSRAFNYLASCLCTQSHWRWPKSGTMEKNCRGYEGRTTSQVCIKNRIVENIKLSHLKYIQALITSKWTLFKWTSWWSELFSLILLFANVGLHSVTFVEFCKNYVTFVSICHLNVLVERFVYSNELMTIFAWLITTIWQRQVSGPPAATTSRTFPSLRKNWYEWERFVWNMPHNFAFL